MAANFNDTVQGMYIAYYGRPGDTGGLTYWAGQLAVNNGNLDAVIDAFGNSAESNARFGGMTAEQKINKLYQTVFSRDADAGGLAYYADLLSTGQASGADIAKRIVDGAQGSDVQSISNKVDIANTFTQTYNTLHNGDWSGFGVDHMSGNKLVNDAAAVEHMISGVNASTDMAALTSYILSNVDQLLLATYGTPVTPPAGLPTTFTNHDGLVLDIIVGTSGDDSFTHTSSNTIYLGMGGNDTFNNAAGATGRAIFVGGAGNDIYNLYAGGRVTVKDIGGGTDTLNSLNLSSSSGINLTVDSRALVSIFQDPVTEAISSLIILGDLATASDAMEQVNIPTQAAALSQTSVLTALQSMPNWGGDLSSTSLGMGYIYEEQQQLVGIYNQYLAAGY